MQQSLGIAFDCRGLPYSDMRAIARLPETRYCDWMHNLCASGGVGQYVVHAFCLAHRACGLPMLGLDEFLESMRGVKKLSKGFFAKRVPPPPAQHIKAFANETLECMVVLQLYCKLEVKRGHAMLEGHIALVQMLGGGILDILTTGDKAVRHAEQLQGMMHRFHEKFLEVLPGLAKPKLHYMNHTPRQMSTHRVNLSCFAPERKHRFKKADCHTVFRHMESALATRNAHDMLWLAQQRGTFVPIKVSGIGKHVVEGDIASFFLKRNVKKPFLYYIDARCSDGWLHKRDMCYWSLGVKRQQHLVRWGVGLLVGIVNKFIRDADGRLFALVEACPPDVDGNLRRSSHFCIAPLEVVHGPMQYREHRSILTPYWPLRL